MMGSNEYKNEQPIHEVTLKAFYMGKYPITQAQYEAVMGNNPSKFKGENSPVEKVSWNDAQQFCQKLSEITGKTYQLPSESQWEYACRCAPSQKAKGKSQKGDLGGSKWCFGDDESLLGDYAWYSANSNRQTHPVGQKKPNNWGLYDMHGNVWEWCEDDYVGNYENTPRDGKAYKNKSMEYIVLCGGSWYDHPKFCRSAVRIRHTRGNRSLYVGFRVVCVVGETP